MMPRTQTSVAHYAAHQLVCADGLLHTTMAVVTLQTADHYLLHWQPFDGSERPHTQWLGGTIILSPYPKLPSVHTAQSHLTLPDWIALLTHPDDSADPSRLYAWHVPTTQQTILTTATKIA